MPSDAVIFLLEPTIFQQDADFLLKPESRCPFREISVSYPQVTVLSQVVEIHPEVGGRCEITLRDAASDQLELVLYDTQTEMARLFKKV